MEVGFSHLIFSMGYNLRDMKGFRLLSLCAAVLLLALGSCGGSGSGGASGSSAGNAAFLIGDAPTDS
jgi:hypothetical protein